MRKTTIVAAGLAAALAFGADSARAQSPVWDVFEFDRPGPSLLALLGIEPAREEPRGDRPVVTVSAPAASHAMGLGSTGALSTSAEMGFFDPIERVWVRYDPNALDGMPRANPIPREEIDFASSEPRGTIIVSTSERRLYLILGNNRALRYGIGVGRDGFTWTGVKSITQMAEWPDWRPPEQMLRRRPDLPRFMPGGPSNPLGARALYLGSTLYRIHGSNEPHTIGQAVSSGCFRMTNEDVADLYGRVRVGARVVVR